MAKEAAAPAAELDMLDAFAKQGANQGIMMLFWLNRHANPDMSVKVTEQDLTEFRACVDYLGVAPQVRMFRPQGRPAHPGSPKTARNEAIPPRAAEPPRNFVVIQLVDKDGNAFKPIESTEEGAHVRDTSNAARRDREKAPQIADQILADASTGLSSFATIQEAARLLKTLAQA